MAQATFAKVKIAIIGGGHMGTALSEGLVRSGIQKSRIIVSRNNNKAAARAAGIIFLCVKPGVVADVLKEIHSEIQGKVVVSSAAALSLNSIRRHAKGARVARIMPNLPVALGEGVVGLLYGSLTSQEKNNLKKLLSGLGLLVEAKNDSELDTLTLIAGCGPGIVASFIEAVAKNAEHLGVSRNDAELISLQVFKGTVANIERNGVSSKEFARSVATKGGVTEMILKTLSQKGFGQTLRAAIDAGRKRIRKISA